MNHGKGGLWAVGRGRKGDESVLPPAWLGDLDGGGERERGDELWLISIAKGYSSSLGIAGGYKKGREHTTNKGISVEFQGISGLSGLAWLLCETKGESPLECIGDHRVVLKKTASVQRSPNTEYRCRSIHLGSELPAGKTHRISHYCG